MGCSSSHLENEGDYFLDNIYSTFPLKIYTFETFEDIYEKFLSDYTTLEQFHLMFNRKFENEFQNSPMKNYHFLIIKFIINKLIPFVNNHDYFKYYFMLFLFPFLCQNISKDEIKNNFKEIIIYLCDFKKSQLDIIKQMQIILFQFFYFIIYELPEIISQHIDETKNEDYKYLIFINNKLNFFNRNRIDIEVNKIINYFFDNLKKTSLSESLNICFEKVPLNYFDIQRLFS